MRTSYGDLDCLGELSGGRSFDSLVGHTVELKLSDGRSVRVLDLPTLIEAKEQAGRPKDLAALPILRATLDEVRRKR